MYVATVVVLVVVVVHDAKLWEEHSRWMDHRSRGWVVGRARMGAGRPRWLPRYKAELLVRQNCE